MAVNLTRSQLKQLYQPPNDEFAIVVVPELRYFMLDGKGAADREPLEHAVRWLFTVVHPYRVEARRRTGKRFVEPPLECLWWADDVADFIAGQKDQMKWRMMIPAPEWADEMLADAIAQAEAKLGEAPDSLRVDVYDEGESVQIMHEGPNEAEVATLRRMHEEFLPAHGLVPNGPHHEIYLDDPKRTAPEKRKTVLRQPVRRPS